MRAQTTARCLRGSQDAHSKVEESACYGSAHEAAACVGATATNLLGVDEIAVEKSGWECTWY